MIVWNGVDRYPGGSPPAIATIGNYDGVHLGHRAIVEHVVSSAREKQLPSLLITFDPHPAAVVNLRHRPRLLQPRRQKLEALEGTRLEIVLIIAFDPSVAALTGREFFSELLGARVPLAALHVGESFRFGHGREGDLALLREIGAERGFEVSSVPAVMVNGEVVSSSAIRRAVEAGDVERARRMLGRPFAVTGEVARGNGRGRAMCFPTANLEVENEMVPRGGVYVTETVALARRYPSVTNVGVRPTFGASDLQVETHLLDFDEDLYGERLEVRFLARLRDEKAFPGPPELADQIARDLAAAASFFQHLENASR